MDLRKIRYVSVLAAERSFVRAAAKLHITQSALSQSISRFEEELGLHLFDRTRGVPYFNARLTTLTSQLTSHIFRT